MSASAEEWQDKQVFSTAEAARYLGIALVTMKKYTHPNHRRITGQKIGNSLVFMRTDLDKLRADLDANPPKAGPKVGSKRKKRQASDQ